MGIDLSPIWISLKTATVSTIIVGVLGILQHAILPFAVNTARRCSMVY